MTSLHAKASYWLRKGIFDDLTSFDDFESRVSSVSEEKDRGDAFEIFVEGYLATQTITQHVRHWVVGSIPLPIRERYNLPRDATGIDGLYEIHDGSHVAYQVKFRQKERLTYAEVAPFLGLTERFSDRVIFTNASALSDKAIQRTRWVSREVFAGLSANALQSIEAWLKEKSLPVTRAKPDPRHQVQALQDIKSTLETNDRATVVMACGTGKTLVALWAAEQQKPKTVLVLVPSLTLLQQTLREWSEQTNWGQRFRYLCVCSDETVGLKDDSWNTDKTEVGFRIDTDPKVVRSFLESKTDEIKVIFSTYHSSPVVGEGAAGLPPIDLAIFDEAHKTTGHSGTAFNFALSDDRLPIRKRLFLTATPRHIDIRHRDKDGEFRIQSMDDESVYGPRAYSLSFAAAARLGIICPYKVVISLIDKEAVTDFARQHGITIVKTDEIGTRWVANLLALSQAAERVQAKKIITFHSRVRLAMDFASAETRGIAHYLDGYDVRHVNGTQSSAERSETIRAFAESPRSLLTNARCLTEGVDIPAVDMVAFVDPRQSRIDIAQAIGRAMRKPRVNTTKTYGYVVVPVFAGSRESDRIEDAVSGEKFDAVADVLNALQEHDDDLLDIIREVREWKGAGEVFDPRRFSERVEVIGPRINLDELTESIGIELADRIGTRWDEGYGALRRYMERQGDCHVPRVYVEGEFKLGSWVHTQRRSMDKMLAERRQRLDAIGFEWNPLDFAWDEGFAALQAFFAQKKHCRVPQGHVEGEFQLGTWVATQRQSIDKMLAERRQRLDAIGFDWNPLDFAWDEGFAALQAFFAQKKHCRVPIGHVVGEFRLGEWVSVQRRSKDKMLAERRQRLDAMGFDWDPNASQWEKGFAALQAFFVQKKHCRVPSTYVEAEFKLGTWVSHQRHAMDKMPADRRQRLDAIGFEWNQLDFAWDEGFAALQAFFAQKKHCRVPQGHVVGEFRLGEWVSVQRKSKDKMPAERRQRLDAMGFDWDPNASQWEKGFAALQAFFVQKKHCRVPNGHVEGEFQLGTWVANQRHSMDKLLTKRRQRLDAMGFDWDPYASQWEKGFAALQAFFVQKKHCRVPKGHVEGEFQLGTWVANQRRSMDKMPAERRQRLDAIGFEWRVRQRPDG